MIINCYTLGLSSEGLPKLTEGITFKSELENGERFGDTEILHYLDFGMLNQTRVYLKDGIWKSGDIIKPIKSARFTLEGHPWPRRKEAIADFARRNPDAAPITLDGIRALCPALYEPRPDEALPIIVHVPTAVGIGIAEGSFPWNRFVRHSFRSDSPTHPKPGFWESGEILAAIAPGPPLGTPLVEVLLEGSESAISILPVNAKWRDASTVPTVVACLSSVLDQARAHSNHSFDYEVANIGSSTQPH